MAHLMTADDAVMRMRILIAEEERPYVDAMRAFARFAQSIASSDTAQGAAQVAENTYKLEQELANIDNVSAAAAHTRAAQLAERDHYDAVMASSDVNLERARQEIAEAKDKLAKAKAVRARKEEYAHVLGQIGQQQARSRSQQLIAQLEQELVALEGEHAAGAAELDLRRRQLALLLHALTVSVETEANDPAIALAAAGRGSQEPDGQL